MLWVPHHGADVRNEKRSQAKPLNVVTIPQSQTGRGPSGSLTEAGILDRVLLDSATQVLKSPRLQVPELDSKVCRRMFSTPPPTKSQHYHMAVLLCSTLRPFSQHLRAR